MSLSQTFGLLVPIFVVIGLGYLAGRLHEFDASSTAALNTLVTGVALPASLFVGTVTTNRSALLGNAPLFGVLAAALLGFYLVVLVIFKRTGFSLPDAAVLALATSQPTFAFMGLPVLGGVVGVQNASIPIALAGIIVNAVLIPVTLVLMAQRPASPEKPSTSRTTSSATAQPSQTSSTDGRADETAAAPSSSARPPSTWATVLSTFKEPLVWGPLLAVALVLIGVPVPGVVRAPLTMLGAASSGVALFCVGLTLVQQRPRLTWLAVGVTVGKIIVQPLAGFGLAHLFGLTSTQTIEATLVTAFPASAFVVIIAVRAGRRVTEIATSLILGVLLSLATLPLIISYA